MTAHPQAGPSAVTAATGGFRFYLDANFGNGPCLCSPECSYVGNTPNDKISSMTVY